ncbi:MAG: hypothetical protein GX375_00735 [Clostridiales bacterium]|nr:hypothetical protein [Clostridiales bacterium]
MNMFGGSNNSFMYPFIPIRDDYDQSKVADDRYHVFVNGDYVGDKLSIAQGDGGWKSIEDYLKGREFTDYRVTKDGDHIYVDVQDEGNAEQIRNHLSVYTQIR